MEEENMDNKENDSLDAVSLPEEKIEDKIDEQEPKKSKKNLQMILILVIIGITTIVAGIIFFNGNITGNVINQEEEPDQEYLDWLSNECKCIEREKLKCFGDFELDEERRLCVNEEKGTVTNVILGCSMYNCSGEVYDLYGKKE